jgi:hypothetical protein
VAERRRLGGLWGVSGEHPILKRTGSYRSSWVDRSDRNHWEQWGSFAGMTVVTVGSAHWLTEYHEEGAGVMPARRVVFLSEEDLAGIGDTCAYVFRGKFRRGG